MVWPEIPMVVCLFALPFTVGTGIAIARFRFLSIGPADLFHTIINHVHEFVIFVDENDRIHYANQATHTALDYPEGALYGMPAEQVIHEYREVREAGEALIKKGNLHNGGVLTLLAAGGAKTTARFYHEPVIDRFGDRRGLLMVGSILQGQTEILEEYAITDQERRIVFMLSQGFTLRRIAGHLGISPGTVKNHVYHIYQKTGVQSRVELVRLTRKPR
jgi:DNA-binding CsgD family transcriptional regulator